MPFRIRLSLIIVGLLLATVLLLPLVWPIPPLEDVEDRRAVAAPGDAFATVEGVELHLRHDAAEGPPRTSLLLIHGFHETLADWHAWPQGLPDGVAAWRYDRIGYGLSERPQERSSPDPYGAAAQLARAEALLQRAEADSVVLVGHGSGAGLAVRLALARPQRVAGLVLLAPVVEERRGAPGFLTVTPQLRRVGPALMRRLGGETGLRFVRSRYADPEDVAPAVLRAHRQATRVERWDEGLWRLSAAPRARGVQARLPEVAAPALVLRGAEDAVLAEASVEVVAEALPRAETATLAGCGHALHDECAAEVLQRLEAWGARELGW